MISKFSEKGLLAAIILLFLCLAFLGVNPYFISDYFDNVMYFELAKNIIESGTYTVGGQYVLEWPPVYPLFLATIFQVTGISLIVGKAITALMTAFALYATYRLLKAENRGPALLIVLIMALLPTTLNMSTRISSDTLYVGLSFTFLYMLHQMKTRRSLQYAALAGLLLGVCTLTRYIGIGFGFAIIFQAATILHKNRYNLKSIAPEILCSTIGLLFVIGWIAKVYTWIADPTKIIYSGHYVTYGAALWEYFDLQEAVSMNLDLIFQWENILDILNLNNSYLKYLYIVPAFVILLGIYEHLKPKNMKPTDIYAIALLIVFAFYSFKPSRFILCIAPFIISYLFAGVKKLSLPPKLNYALLTAWCLFLFSTDVVLLTYGNWNDYGGLSPLISKTPEEFYKGKWKDIYNVSLETKHYANNPKSTLGLQGYSSNYWMYFHTFSGMPIAKPEIADFVIQDQDDETTPRQGYRRLTENANYKLWKSKYSE